LLKQADSAERIQISFVQLQTRYTHPQQILTIWRYLIGGSIDLEINFMRVFVKDVIWQNSLRKNLSRFF